MRTAPMVMATIMICLNMSVRNTKRAQEELGRAARKLGG
jgi:hypothetical protein